MHIKLNEIFLHKRKFTYKLFYSLLRFSVQSKVIQWAAKTRVYLFHLRKNTLNSHLPKVNCVVKAFAVVVPPLASVLKLSENTKKGTNLQILVDLSPERGI